MADERMSRGLVAIHGIANAAPELSLAAALIRLALEDAMAGDDAAARWLESDECGRWLAELVDGVGDRTVARVQRRLLALVRR